ncbi:MAG: DNRLRE domain-containing protein [Deltaproteobacteria bacterium]|nr:DNRLRE domain-containing protein [Deltaproteobacteria bacterium]
MLGVSSDSDRACLKMAASLGLCALLCGCEVFVALGGGEGLPCKDDQSCPPGLLCIEQSCARPAACRTNEDCANGICINSICIAVPDAGTGDTALPDTALPDMARPDTCAPDVRRDAQSNDSRTPDSSAPSDAGASRDASVVIVMYPTADAMIYSMTRYRDTNYGSAELLSLHLDTRRFYIRFDLSEMTGEILDNLVSVSISYLPAHENTCGGAHYRCTSSWAESEVTWNDQPTRSATLMGSTPAWNSLEWKSVSLDLDEFRAMVAANRGMVVLGTQSTIVTGYSRQSSHPPQMRIVYNRTW